MRHFGVVMVLCASVVVTAPGAWAASKKSVQQDACAADVRKFCKDALPDEDKVAACMKDKKSQVSPKCAAQWDAKD